MLTRRSALVAGLACAVLAVATIGVQEHKIHGLEADGAQLALKETNDSAARAKTVEISAVPAIARAAGDSSHVFQRLAVQTAQQPDAVDRALRMTRLALDSANFRIDSLQRVVASNASVTEDSTSHVRRASFNLRQAPYTVAAAVELPAAPDTARLDLRIKLDSIPVVARLSCAPANERGIRAAAIEAQTPRWAAVSFTHVEQSPDLCASPALAGSGRRSLLKFKPLVIGAGRIVEPDGTSRWGAFIGAGFAIGST